VPLLCVAAHLRWRNLTGAELLLPQQETQAMHQHVGISGTVLFWQSGSFLFVFFITQFLLSALLFATRIVTQMEELALSALILLSRPVLWCKQAVQVAAVPTNLQSIAFKCTPSIYFSCEADPEVERKDPQVGNGEVKSDWDSSMSLAGSRRGSQ